MDRFEYRASFEGLPGTVRQARAFVADSLGQSSGVDKEALDLVVSELVTNVVVHARTPFEVLVVVDSLRLRIEVADLSRAAPVSKPWSEDAEGGRGLWIVAAIARSWGYEVTNRGKVVWVEVDAASST
jgi:anti-sigma regulatory factor (Ser/Thr protein kinase)